jgi:putative NADPH-quinone reductase
MNVPCTSGTPRSGTLRLLFAPSADPNVSMRALLVIAHPSAASFSHVVFNTSNTPLDRESAACGDPLQQVWRDCVFALCGVHRFERRTFGPMASSTPELRSEWLAEARAMVAKHA